MTLSMIFKYIKEQHAFFCHVRQSITAAMVRVLLKISLIEVPRDVRNSKSGNMISLKRLVSTLEDMQVQNGTRPGIRRSKRSLVRSSLVTRSQVCDKSVVTAYTHAKKSKVTFWRGDYILLDKIPVLTIELLNTDKDNIVTVRKINFIVSWSSDFLSLISNSMTKTYVK